MKITIFCLCTSSIKFNLIKKKFEKSNNAFDITRIESTSQFNDFQLLKNPDAFIIYDENPDIIKSLIDYIKTCYPKTPVIAITDSKTEKEIVDSFYYENYLIISTAFIDTLPTFIGKILKIDTDTNNEKDKINDSYSLRNLKYVLDNIPEIVYIKNLDDFTLVYLNKSGELITGYKKEEVIGRKVQDIFIFDKDNYVENKICESLIENEIMEVTDNSILTKNNLVKVFSTKKILLNDDHGHPKYIISVSSEKIDSTKTEKELQKSLIRFSKMFHSSPIPIAMVREKDNVFIDINKSYLEMLGFEREEVIGNKPEILDIWDNFNDRIQIINLAKQNSTVLNHEIRLHSRKGRKITALASVEYMRYEGEEPWFLFMVLDITEQKKIEEEKMLALEREKDLNLLKSSFISMVSHEFRTPLTTIMLSADLLKRFGDKWGEDEKVKHFARIQDTILKMIQLMENVLTIGRLQAGKFDFQPERLDLPALCTAIIENILFTTSNKNPINFIFNGGGEEAMADENLLWLILSNLLTNAVKYSPNCTPIELELTCSKDNAVFRIQDRGIGIPPKDIENLFQLFYRASNVPVSSGYGMGLAIVERCIDAHKGKIEVKSEVGSGTEFTVTIPLKHEVPD